MTGLLIVFGVLIACTMLRCDGKRHAARMDRIYTEHFPDPDGVGQGGRDAGWYER